MKRLILLFTLSLVGMVAVGCDSGEKDPQFKIEGVLPVEASAEVAAFMDENAKSIARVVFGENVVQNGDYRKFDKCIFINSEDKLRNVAPGIVEFPDIDFGKYTLIVGQYVASHGGFYLAAQNIDIEDDTATINLYIGTIPDDHHQAFEINYFWGLYPKIPEELSEIAINRKDV